MISDDIGIQGLLHILFIYYAKLSREVENNEGHVPIGAWQRAQIGVARKHNF